MKWQVYGTDIELILLEFYINPIPYLRQNLRKIGNYRSKEKSIGIPIILDNKSFFKLDPEGQQIFLNDLVIQKLGLVREKVKRNKLNFDIERLMADVKTICGTKTSS